MSQLSVADYRLEARAEKSLWPITQEHRDECVKNALVDLKDGDARVRKAAREYLLRVDEVNDKKLDAEQKRLADEHSRKLQYIELLVKLGLVVNDSGRDGGLVEAASVRGDTGS